MAKEQQEKIGKVSPRGCVTIPIDWRHKLGIKIGDVVILELTGEKICVIPAEVRRRQAIKK